MKSSENTKLIFFSLFWINWFWNIFVYTVVKVFTSIYLKYWKEHLNIFYLFYISSALKNNAVRSFLCFYVFSLWYTIFDRGHMFSQFWCILTRMNKWDTQGVKSTYFTKEFNLYSFYRAHAASHFSVNIHWIFFRSF